MRAQLCEAAGAGKLELVQSLLRDSQEPARLLSTADANGNVALHYAAAGARCVQEAPYLTQQPIASKWSSSSSRRARPSTIRTRR